jgi:hypothetical protein
MAVPRATLVRVVSSRWRSPDEPARSKRGCTGNDRADVDRDHSAIGDAAVYTPP